MLSVNQCYGCQPSLDQLVRIDMNPGGMGEQGGRVIGWSPLLVSLNLFENLMLYNYYGGTGLVRSSRLRCEQLHGITLEDLILEREKMENFTIKLIYVKCCFRQKINIR